MIKPKENKNAMNNTFMNGRFNYHILVSFIILVLVITSHLWFKEVNQQFFIGINGYSKFMDPSIWCSLTLFGDTSILWPILVLFMWNNPRTVFAAVFAIPFGGTLSVLLKHLFNAPRPAQWTGATDITILGPVLTGNSFPSGHTITAFAAACAILVTIEFENKIKQKFIALSIFVFACLIGLSRVMVGAHWPYDVFAGACVGWIGGISGLILADRLEIFWQKIIIQQVTLIVLWLVSFYNLFREFEYSQGEAAVWISFSLTTIGVILFFLSGKKNNKSVAFF
jgi:hypothetical protein